MSRSSSSCQTLSRGRSPRNPTTAVSVADVLELRAGGRLNESETWALLCQAVQSLQDLFLSDDSICMCRNTLPAVTPSSLVVTARGRVSFVSCGDVSWKTRRKDTSNVTNGSNNDAMSVNGLQIEDAGYIAPEYSPGARPAEAEIEKMWIYSLGATLQRTLCHNARSIVLQAVLESMTRSDPFARASLMYLLDEPKTDKDDEWCKQINEVINNPPSLGGIGLNDLRAAGNDSRIQSLLNGLSQQQFMQLYGMAGARSASLLGSLRPRNSNGHNTSAQSGATSLSSNSAGLPETPKPPTTTDSKTKTSESTSNETPIIINILGHRVQLADLQNYLSSLTAPEQVPSVPTVKTKVDLAAALNIDALQPVIRDDKRVAALQPHLPPSGAEPSAPREHLRDTLASPQFHQVISDYCRSQRQTRPFSHVVMALYQEVLGEPQLNLREQKLLADAEDKMKRELKSDTDSGRSSAVFTGHYSNLPSHSLSDRISETSETSNTKRQKNTRLTREASTCTDIAMFRTRPLANSGASVAKAASTLPRRIGNRKTDEFQDGGLRKQLIGPEFVYRSRNPCVNLIIADCKASMKRQVTVILLNGQKLDITCDPTHTTAGDIFQAIIQSENLEENFTLGLSVMLSGDFVFLPDDTKIHKVAPAGWTSSSKLKKSPGITLTLLLFLRIKFFLPNLRGIRNTQTKHLLYLQLRRSILEQQLVGTLPQIVMLSGFALQAEFGNFANKDHGNSEYFLLEHYLPENYIAAHDENILRQQLEIAHQQKHGLSCEKAEECFVLQAQDMRDYGAHFYTAVWITKSGFDRDVWISITSQGITLEERFPINQKVDIKDRNILEVFHWKGIQTLCYSKHYLCIVPHSKIKGKKARKYKLKMDNKKSYFTFRLASLHHQFFLKLRTAYSSLHTLSEEFGIPLKDIKNENNKLYKIQSLSNHNLNELIDKEPPIQFKVISRDSSQSSCDNQEKEIKSRLRNKLKRRSKSTTDIRLIGKELRLEEFQNKENENPKYEEYNKDSIRQNTNFILGENVPSLPRRLGVKMGTRAFSGTIHRDQFLSLNEINNSLIELDNKHRECMSMEPNNLRNESYNELMKYTELNSPDLELPSGSDEMDRLSLRSVSLHSMCFQSEKTESEVSPIPEAYVIPSSLKSVDEKYMPDFQESISTSLLEKLNNMSFEEERILTTVKVTRDSKLSLGIQIAEGSDGNVYVQNVIIGGAAYNTGRIHNGDHIIAVNGVSLINQPYKESLNILQNTGKEVELTLSQVYEQRPDSLILKSKTYKQTPVRKPTDSFGKKCNGDLYKSCLTNVAQNKMSSKGNKPEDVYMNDIRNKQASEDNLEYAKKKIPTKQVVNTSQITKTLSMPHLCEEEKNNSNSSDKRKALMNKIALPKSLSLSRKWLGPVRYPVTPSKECIVNKTPKLSLRSGNSNNVSINVDGSFAESMISDDEQVFI